ncbi:hypothetical protein L484_018711 [Morus notabilis]|uniref:Uncharacterized protein n=1 Tax=Morus notabilis TaxID=981085 RepID=W9RPD4_9ROSA|nr:hypothetical protein L484_018711 [Morus notabilis]
MQWDLGFLSKNQNKPRTEISKNHEGRRGKIVPAVVSRRRRQQSINFPSVKCLRWPQLESWSRGDAAKGDAARAPFLLIGDKGRRGPNWVKKINWRNGKAIQATPRLNEDSLKLSESAFPRKAILENPKSHQTDSSRGGVQLPKGAAAEESGKLGLGSDGCEGEDNE